MEMVKSNLFDNPFLQESIDIYSVCVKRRNSSVKVDVRRNLPNRNYITMSHGNDRVAMATLYYRQAFSDTKTMVSSDLLQQCAMMVMAYFIRLTMRG